jgi:hypothetical protein
MSELLDPTTSADDTSDESTPKRLVGFGLTALGGMLIGVGALLPWIRSSVTGFPDELSPTYYGVDLPDGSVVLAAAAVVLGGLAITRLVTSPRSKRIAAGAVVAASFVTLAVAGAAVVTAAGRFEPDVVDEMLAEIDPSGTGTAAPRRQIEELVETRLAPGPFVALTGGVLGLAGGLLLFSWVAREHDDPFADQQARPALTDENP